MTSKNADAILHNSTDERINCSMTYSNILQGNNREKTTNSQPSCKRNKIFDDDKIGKDYKNIDNDKRSIVTDNNENETFIHIHKSFKNDSRDDANIHSSSSESLDEVGEESSSSGESGLNEEENDMKTDRSIILSSQEESRFSLLQEKHTVRQILSEMIAKICMEVDGIEYDEPMLAANENLIDNNSTAKLKNIAEDISKTLPSKSVLNDSDDPQDVYQLPSNEAMLRLPTARVKNIIRLDPEVKLCNAEATFLIGKATEFFLRELANDSYEITKASSSRRTLQKRDVDYLLDMSTNDGGYARYAFLEDTI